MSSNEPGDNRAFRDVLRLSEDKRAEGFGEEQ